MPMPISLQRRRFVLFTLACTACNLVVAATIPTDETDEIIVTATKIPLAFDSVHSAPSLLTPNTINALDLQSVNDVAHQVPGLSTIDTGARNPDVIIIRGINFDAISANDLGSDSGTVSTYFNSIPLQGYYTPPQPLMKDLERIEVWKGPQGTLYGASSLSGLILYQSKRPDLQNNYAVLESNLSSTDKSNALANDSSIVVNTTLQQGTTGIRALYNQSKHPGFIDNESLLTGPRDDINDAENKAGRISLTHVASDKLQLDFMIQKQDLDVGDRQADNIVGGAKQYTATSKYLQPSASQFQIAEIHLNYAVTSDATLDIAATDYHLEQRQTRDLTDLYITTYGYPPDNTAYENSTVNVSQQTLELRYSEFNRHNIYNQVGFFYSKNKLSADIEEFLTTPTTQASLEYSARQKQMLSDYALFGESSFHLTPKHSITIGARRFYYHDKASATNTFCADPTLCQPGEVNANHGLLKLSTLHSIGEHEKIYTNISQGFRRGGANPAIPYDLADRQTYKPDTTVNYEIGFKIDSPEDSFHSHVSTFYIDWKALQLVTSEVSPITSQWVNYITNAGKAASYGIEFEHKGRIGNSLQLITNYSYTKAQLSKDIKSYNASAGNGDNGYKHDRLPGSPQHKAYFALTYTKPWGEREISAQISLSHYGDVTTQLNNEHADYRKLSSYNLSNVYTSMAFATSRIGFFIRNLANKRAVTGYRGETYFGSQGSFEYINEPRTIGMDLMIAFQ